MSEIAILIPEPDEEYLQEKGYEYELKPQSGAIHLILKNVPFSEAFNPRQADILIIIPAGYPNAKLDMFWTFPHVRLQNGNYPAACNHFQSFHDKNWQRWSRHGLWRGGVDNLRTFISSIKKEIDHP